MPFQISQEVIAPGEHRVVRIPVGRLASNNVISIRAHVYRSYEPGPTALFLGGVHGDEINGVEIVRRLVASDRCKQLLCGSVIAIPLLNIYGFINFSRDVPDGKDVNRAFPGSANGSLAARVAYILSQDILPHVSFGVDFHTGGNNNYNYPQVRYTAGQQHMQELAQVFGAPVQLATTPPKKSLRQVALQKYKLPLLVYEGGENLRYDGISIQHGLDGIGRILHHHQMLASAPAQLAAPLHFKDARWVRAPRSGMFEWYKPSGNPVRKGEPIAVINDPLARSESKRILSPRDGYIIAHNNTPVVNQGDALFHIAYPMPG